MTNKLLSYIQNYNRKADKYNQENKSNGNFMCLITDDMNHWSDYKIYTLRDYVRYQLETAIWDTFKSIHGFRPRFLNFKKMGIRELRQELNQLTKENNND